MDRYSKVNDSLNTTRLDFVRDDSKYLFDGLREISKDKDGVTRGSYSEEESKALNFLIDYAISNGLSVTEDKAKNVVFSLQEHSGSDKYTLIGSHIDSVPQGGNYDGAAGIVAGLVCLAYAQKKGHVFPKAVKVIAIRGEESAWFGSCYVGSRALFGKLDAKELEFKHRHSGESLSECMEKIGIDVSPIRKQTPLVDKNEIEAYLELHIEQGPVLVELDKPLAIVSGIRGNVRHRSIHCIGESGHSGAVPREFRHDSVFAVSSLLVRLDDHWKTLLDHGADLVVTSGIVSTNYQEHAMSRIPGDVTFSFEARSEHEDVLNTVASLLDSESKIVERERKVRFEFDGQVTSKPAILDNKIVSGLKSSAKKLDYGDFVMASGAGHDAAVFANSGVPAGMIFVRNQNGSHNPNEAMNIDDFMQATSVLYTYVMGD